MRYRADYVIVGAGLTGATIARALADAGRDVLVLERRAHVGGNVFDEVHESGIRFHTFGPHYFRTNSDRIWAFVCRFADFFPYEAALRSLVDGRLEQWPIAASYIARTVGRDWRPSFRGTPANFEEASLSMMPREVYEKFVKGYSEKQWGVPATALEAGLARRFDVREDDEPRLMRHVHQGIPRDGYAAFTERLVAGLSVARGVDFLQVRDEVQADRCLVFTGPIDEFYGFDLGRLAYRGQVREHRYLPNVQWAQPVGQVNNPDPRNGAHIRTLEWKHMMPPDARDAIRGTLLTTETTVTPTDPGDYEYPFPDQANAVLYGRYRARAKADPRLLVCGRLGEYRYYDMDQAIARAMVLARRLIDPTAAADEPT